MNITTMSEKSALCFMSLALLMDNAVCKKSFNIALDIEREDFCKVYNPNQWNNFSTELKKIFHDSNLSIIEDSRIMREAPKYLMWFRQRDISPFVFASEDCLVPRNVTMQAIYKCGISELIIHAPTVLRYFKNIVEQLRKENG